MTWMYCSNGNKGVISPRYQYQHLLVLPLRRRWQQGKQDSDSELAERTICTRDSWGPSLRVVSCDDDINLRFCSTDDDADASHIIFAFFLEKTLDTSLSSPLALIR